MPSDALLHPTQAQSVKSAALDMMARHGLGALLIRRRELEAATPKAHPPAAAWIEPAPPPSYRTASRSVELAELGKAWTERVHAVAEAHPPFGVALLIASLIQRFLNEPIGLGGKVPRDFRDLAATAFKRITQTWAPDFDDESFAATLSDERTLRALVEQGAPALGTHPTLGYAPVSLADLTRLGAIALAPQLEALLVSAHRETEEWRAWAAELQARRKARRFWDGPEIVDAGIMEARERELKERVEAMIATETLFEAITGAANAFGPFRLRAGLRPLLDELHLPETTRERVFSPASGAVHRGDSVFGRAVMGHALARLKRDLELVFPGLYALASGAPSEADLQRLNDQAVRRSPFREEAPDPDFEPATTEDQLFQAFDRAGLFRILDQAHAHAGALGGLREAARTAKGRVTVIDRINAFGHSSREAARDGIEARRHFHAEALRACATHAGQIAFRDAHGFFQIDAYRALDQLHQAITRLRAILVQPDMHHLIQPKPTAFVVGDEDVARALSDLARVMSRATHLSGTKLELAQRVAALLLDRPTANPFRGEPRLLRLDLVARGVAETLRERSGTAFAERLRAYGASIQTYEQQSASASIAKQSVTFWDRLNPFTTERQRAAAGASVEAERLLVQSQLAFRELHLELASALVEYPPGAVFYGLSEVQVVAQQIHGRVRKKEWGSRHDLWEAVLVGREELLGALTHWTRGMMTVFGVLWSPGEILERYAIRNLV